MDNKLALLGGQKAIQSDIKDMFKWPIITKEDEDAALGVLREGAMSGIEISKKYEKEFAKWQGTKHALSFCNGTASIQAAMFGCKIGIGDEIICPSITYWASAVQVFSLGGTVVFADLDPKTLCIDPKDIEHRINKNTKAIMVVHYMGHPADMDEIMVIAKKHNLKVIEDVSHAQGGLYKGRKLGTIGDVGAMSLMSGKSLVAGEGGMITTDDTEIYERAILFGHYARHNDSLNIKELKQYAGLPIGGYKYRINQISSAIGMVQLKYYDKRAEEIRKSVNYFWDLLEGVPGIKPHRVDKDSGSNMGGWYVVRGFYKSEELGGLSITRFTEAIRAEGVISCSPGCNKPMHTHPLFSTCDVYNHGKPTRIANSDYDVRKYDKDLPISENIGKCVFSAPWFKHFRPDIIKQHADAFRKVSKNYKELLKDDLGDPEDIGGWSTFNRK